MKKYLNENIVRRSILKFKAKCSSVMCSSTRLRTVVLKCSVLVLAIEHQMLEHCSLLINRK